RLNPAARIVMTGCFAQANPQRLAKAVEVDAVVGLGRLEDIERAALSDNDQRVMVSNLRKERAQIELAPVALSGQTRAFLKIQEGCDQFCSFCIVPTSRGTSRSVAPRRIITALEGLAERGFKEVTLSGVHLGGYGKDLDPPVELETLLDMIAERSPINRIRISSLDPEELSDEVIDIVAASGKFCPHFHLPMQAGDDQILAGMRRRYDVAYFRDRVEKILRVMPDAAIGTDLIVGFPGESTRQFDTGFKFAESLPLAYFHVFPYSVRAGTTAAKFHDKVAAPETSRRAALMRELGQQKRAQFAQRYCGARLEVLLEERGASGQLAGYSRNYIRTLTEGPDSLANQEVLVEGLFADGAQLVGEIVPGRAGSSHVRAGAAS
ncbi:MAG TPA: MiaB/RimO family radical SAM methylthiotransferase, partial [Candidatus Binataceae bacterium]|nr:MiaB/RimO family radical SAM methylthiotransferase [Candidatus Binataceae bacterium]